jgi:hypothetical protein
MLIAKQEIVRVHLKAGLAEEAEEADRTLPDPVELERAAEFGNALRDHERRVDQSHRGKPLANGHACDSGVVRKSWLCGARASLSA